MNALRLALLASLLVACGDNLTPGGGGEIDAPSGDGGPVDAPLDAQACVARNFGDIGGPCNADVDCESAAGAADGLCMNNLLDPAPWPAAGYCISRLAGCTQDGECGDGNVCVDLGGGFRACMQGCNAAGPCECPDSMVCSDGWVNTPVQRMVCVPGNRLAVDGSPCTTFGDCDEHSICLADAFEHPGGQCMQLGCTIGNDATCTSGGDGHCDRPDVIGGGTGCLDVCTTDADCRTIDGYECFDSGAAGRFCRHPATGDGCTQDSDCGSPVLWVCRTGVTFPGGYCTIRQSCPTNGTTDGCSSGSSVCRDPVGPEPGYCVDRCTGGPGQGTCRAGYNCLPVGNVSGCF